VSTDVRLFPYTTSGEADDQCVQQASDCFDSPWTTIAHEYTP
jgi:hypothetical protein